MKILPCLLLLAASLASAQPLPDQSIYHYQSQWQDQDGRQLALADLRGSVQLVAFIYSYCEHTCPLIVTRIRQVEQSLGKEQQARLRVTLVSLDPGRDTPERLDAYMREQRLDRERWTMLSGDPEDVLALSAMFGVRYRPMGESDLAHSNMITALDANGVIVAQLKGLGENNDILLEPLVPLLTME